MRELKFRGKRTDNGKWVYGDVLNRINTLSKDKAIVVFDGYVIPKSVKVFNESIGQYTGLKDKNGKEIYEGDIVYFSVFDCNGLDTQYKGVVKFTHGKWEIWQNNEQEHYGSDAAFELYWMLVGDDELEIIGNIHENHELLEEIR